MAQELTLKTHHNPSIFNKEMLLGGLLGLFVPGALIVTAVTVAGSALLGGWLGKRQQEQENKEGKKVGEPTFWSKDTLIGGLIGNQVGALIGGVAFVAIVGTALLTSGIPTREMLSALSDPHVAGAGIGAARLPIAEIMTGIGAFAASWIGGTAIGTYLGNWHGKSVQAKEYEEAKQQAIVQNISQNVSPEIAQAVEYRLANDKQWGKQMLEEKLLAAGPKQMG